MGPCRDREIPSRARMLGPKERGQGPDGGGIVARIGRPRGSLYPSLGEGVEEDFLGKGTSEARPKGQIGATREGMTREAAGSSLSAGVTDTPAQTPGLLHPYPAAHAPSFSALPLRNSSWSPQMRARPESRMPASTTISTW